MLRIKLVRSPIGNTKSNRATVAALGLRKMNQVIERPDNPGIRGMVHKVKHLLAVEEFPDSEANLKATSKPKITKSKAERAAKAEKAVKAVKAPAPVKEAKVAAKKEAKAPKAAAEAKPKATKPKAAAKKDKE